MFVFLVDIFDHRRVKCRPYSNNIDEISFLLIEIIDKVTDSLIFNSVGFASINKYSHTIAGEFPIQFSARLKVL